MKCGSVNIVWVSTDLVLSLGDSADGEEQRPPALELDHQAALPHQVLPSERLLVAEAKLAQGVGGDPRGAVAGCGHGGGLCVLILHGLGLSLGVGLGFNCRRGERARDRSVKGDQTAIRAIQVKSQTH